ncbi:MAG: TonB-dependent siderophore receptor, partial [Sphingomonadales bacterium]
MIAKKTLALLLLSGVALPAFAARAAEAESAAGSGEETIIVTGLRELASSGSKTETPVIKLPQALTVVTAETYLSQGAISISDTLNYVAGVTANPYGPDSRVDGGFVRGLNPLQYRDGMRDLFSYYASIRSDPYNFSRVELVRGPASSLFGSGALGGLLNMVSKTPEFTTGGEASLRYGSNDRKELLADVQGKLTDTVAA